MGFVEQQIHNEIHAPVKARFCNSVLGSLRKEPSAVWQSRYILGKRKRNKMNFLSACVQFFGLKDGQSPMQFGKDEYKKLTNADKLEIYQGFQKLGIACDPPVVSSLSS